MSASTPTPSAPPRTKYHLVLFQPQDADHGAAHSTIDRDLVRAIQELLDSVVTTPPEQTEIDIWLESPGGDAHAAYKLVIDLRARAHSITAIVIDFAKSAATLVALGADMILMGRAAELGPLDAQIPHPDREDYIVSALDVTNSLEFLGRAALNMGLNGGGAIIQVTGLPRADALGTVLSFVAQLLNPAMAKLDPHLIHQSASLLKVSEQYALAVLSSGHRADKSPALRAAAPALVKRLVNQYPTHGYVISRDEASRIGLPVASAEEHPRWEQMRATYKKFIARNSVMIQAFPDSALDPVAEPQVKSNNAANGSGNDEQERGNGADHAEAGG